MMETTIGVTILHTNDMHCELEAMSRLSTFARRLQGELNAQGRRVFLFDAGDAADRRVRFCSLTKGAAFPLLMEAMGDHGYDLQTLGNAISVTYGPQAAVEMAQRSRFPILAANFFQSGNPLVGGFQPTASFPLAGDIHLNVIGLTVQAPQFYSSFGLELPHFLDSANEWAAKIKKQTAGPLLVLSHLGLNEDRMLAQSLPEIEVIIGGHSHSLLLDGEFVNGVLITQAGEYAKHLGRVDLVVDIMSGEVLEKNASMIEIPAETPPDPFFQSALQKAEEEAIQVMNKPVGELLEALELDHFNESEIGNLAADAVRDRLHAEAAILCGGLFHKGLPAGVVRLIDLDEACFSTANPQLSLVRGEQIRLALERGLEPALMHTFFKAFRGTPQGLPAISGMAVDYDPDAADGMRVRKITIQNSLLVDDQLYRLAHTDAEVRSEDLPSGLIDLESDQVLQVDVPTIVREAIEGYLQNHLPTPKPTGGRWRKVEG